MPESSTSDKPVSFAFNAKNREAQRIARDYTAAQIKLISSETKRAIQQIITRSIQENIRPRDAARLVRGVVGMNRPQMKAFHAYFDNLSKQPIQRGEEGRAVYSTKSRQKWAKKTAQVKQKAMDAYSKKLTSVRAVMIARTEVIDALNLGAEVAWKQAQGQGLLGKEAKKEWLTTPVGACNVCLALNGKSVKIGGKFQTPRGAVNGPTAHPNCRCGIAPVP